MRDHWRDKVDEQDHPFDVNDCGIWCVNCGEHIAAPWNVKDVEDYKVPETCPKCGFPDEMTGEEE